MVEGDLSGKGFEANTVRRRRLYIPYRSVKVYRDRTATLVPLSPMFYFAN